MREQLLKLPETPGTVIAIGGWWLVRLEPYEDGEARAWELLPFRTKAMSDRAAAINVKAQCVYGDDWVLAEAEQEGGYVVIAEPVSQRYGIGYKPAKETEELGQMTDDDQQFVAELRECADGLMGEPVAYRLLRDAADALEASRSVLGGEQ